MSHLEEESPSSSDDERGASDLVETLLPGVDNTTPRHGQAAVVDDLELLSAGVFLPGATGDNGPLPMLRRDSKLEEEEPSSGEEDGDDEPVTVPGLANHAPSTLAADAVVPNLPPQQASSTAVDVDVLGAIEEDAASSTSKDSDAQLRMLSTAPGIADTVIKISQQPATSANHPLGGAAETVFTEPTPPATSPVSRTGSGGRLRPSSAHRVPFFSQVLAPEAPTDVFAGGSVPEAHVATTGGAASEMEDESERVRDLQGSKSPGGSWVLHLRAEAPPKLALHATLAVQETERSSTSETDAAPASTGEDVLAANTPGSTAVASFLNSAVVQAAVPQDDGSMFEVEILGGDFQVRSAASLELANPHADQQAHDPSRAVGVEIPVRLSRDGEVGAVEEGRGEHDWESAQVPGALPLPSTASQGGPRRGGAQIEGASGMGWGDADEGDLADDMARLRRNRGVGGGVDTQTDIMLAAPDEDGAEMGGGNLQPFAFGRADAGGNAVVDMRPWEFKLLDVAGGQLEGFGQGLFDGEEAAMVYQVQLCSRQLAVRFVICSNCSAGFCENVY